MVPKRLEPLSKNTPANNVGGLKLTGEEFSKLLLDSLAFLVNGQTLLSRTVGLYGSEKM